MEDNKRSVLIVVPTLNSIHYEVVGILCRIILSNTKYDIDVTTSAMRGIGEHRNIIARDFLKTGRDFLLMIDSDNPPPANVLDLIDLDKDVISCPTPINMDYVRGVNNFYWNVFNDDGYPIQSAGNGLEKVVSAGTGCVLIKKEVLEKIKHPFTTIRDEEDLRIVGTDIAFCNKCTKAGIDIHVHWDYRCGHYKEINLASLI
jgi:GT2 family glycosyltransferase